MPSKRQLGLRVYRPEPFANTPIEVSAMTDLSSGAKLLFGVINGLDQASLGCCIASNEELARRTGKSVSWTRRLLSELEDARLITRTIAHGRRQKIRVSWIPGINGISVQRRASKRARRAFTITRCADTSTEKTVLEDSLEEGACADVPSAPDPPPGSRPPVWDARQQEVIDLATQRWGACNGDFIVGDLLRTYTAEIVMAAIDRHWDKVGPGLRPSLLRATCEGLFNDSRQPRTENRQPATKPAGRTYGIRPGP
jgi:Helix-turn-helix domain